MFSEKIFIFEAIAGSIEPNYQIFFEFLLKLSKNVHIVTLLKSHYWNKHTHKNYFKPYLTVKQMVFMSCIRFISWFIKLSSNFLKQCIYLKKYILFIMIKVTHHCTFTFGTIFTSKKLVTLEDFVKSWLNYEKSL